jgi:2,3-dihydroxy-p-cumate/2,3-dihydroxybenzoate 3,4-dioxygenase
MVSLRDIRYVRLGTADVDAAADYARRILGLEEVRREAGSAYLRSDARDHTLVYAAGDPAVHVAGFDVGSAKDLDTAAAALDAAGVEARAGTRDACDARGVGGMLAFADPSGNAIELVHGTPDGRCTFTPSRDAGITGFSHIGLRSRDPVRDERFWTGVMGARVSDRIGTCALLRINSVHHTIALFPSDRPGVQHVNHQTASFDDIMRSWYWLRTQGVRIVFGPGRHPTSGAIFLYFEGPDGMVYEYSTGVRHIAPEDEATHVPRQFPFAPAGFCMWGSRPDIAEFRE